MHRAQQQVRDFHRATRTSRPNAPLVGGLRGAGKDFWMEFLLEEFTELQGAATITEQIRELCDILYVTYGIAVALGVDLEPYFEEVHKANMEKAGGPKREDGKQLKPEGWVPPDINGIFYKGVNQ